MIMEHLAFYALVLICGTVLFRLVQLLLKAFDPDLRKIPGPFKCHLTNLPLKVAVLTGQRSNFIHDIHQKYGPIVRISPKEVSIADIKTNREIHRIGTHFVKAPWYQNQSPYQADDDHAGVFGLVNARKAAARRKFFMQANTKPAVAAWEPQIIEFVDRAVGKIKRDALAGNADLVKWWTMMTADVLGSLAFGEPFNVIEKEEKPQLIHDIEMSMVLLGIKGELPWLWPFIKNIPIPGIGVSVLGMIHRIRAAGEIAVKNTKGASKGSAKTLFCKMMPEDENDSEAQPFFSDALLSDEAGNMIIAGTDTTATALIYLVYEVLRHPKIKDKLLQELKTCTPHPSWEELESKTYLNNVISETLRLHSPVGATLPRTNPTEDVVFLGYKIPAGTIVGSQAYSLHRDPKAFGDPLTFNPDRWNEPTNEMRDAFMAFGGTVRTCLGQNVARCEMLHAVCRFFRECGENPNLRIADGTNEKTVAQLDFFITKPAAGKVEITMTEKSK